MDDDAKRVEPSDWLEDLGQVVWLGSLLEVSFRHLFGRLLTGETAAASVLAAGQTVSWLAEYCVALAESKTMPEPHLGAFRRHVTAAKEAYEDRNRVVHGAVLYDEAEAAISLFGSRRIKGQTERRLTVDEMKQLIERLNRAGLRLFAAAYLVDVHLNKLDRHPPRPGFPESLDDV